MGSGAGTGGPKDGPKILEHVMGWAALVVVLATFVTHTGLM
ncbi:SCO1431 family membrane protein [Streptomyces hypolithicus]